MTTTAKKPRTDRFDPTIEPRWREYWEREGIFNAGRRPDAPNRYILEMFPYPSGDLHVGHLKNYVIGDALTRRKRPIASLEELEAAVQRWAGRRGVARLREALALVRPRTDSVRETELRLAASDFGLPEPEVNGRILDDDGRFVAFGDLVYRRWRVILEYDGEQHRTDERQFARDVERLDDLARLGWRVVRVSKQHRGPRRIQRLRRVREALIERGWSPNTTP